MNTEMCQKGNDKMKKITSLAAALLLILSCTACGNKENSPVSGDISASPVSDTNDTPHITSLTDHMTEKERSMIKCGELTVTDHTLKKPDIPQEGVALEIWSPEYNLDFWTHYHEYHPNDDYMTDEDIAEVIESCSEIRDDIIHSAFVDGEIVDFAVLPSLDYDGSPVEFDVAPNIFTSERDGELVSFDEEGNEITQEEADALSSQYEKWVLNDDDDIRDYIAQIAESYINNGMIDEKDKDKFIENNLKIWQAVRDNSYVRAAEGSADLYYANIYGNYDIPVWEIDVDEVEKIAPYVKEYNIYDEQLDTNFVVHVTLPPDFDASETYPAYVLTDGVWRFNNCPAMRQAMEDGKASDVILVSIGFDYSMDGMDDDNRKKYLCENCEGFLDFITDDLMPYLGEEYNIDFSDSTLYGHSLGGTFAHYAAFNSDKYENQPFKNYIIGSPAFWSPGFLPYTDGESFRHEYYYFDRNDSFDKHLFVCGGADEDPVYEEYYGENDSTLTGIQHFMERLEGYGVKDAECKIYPDSEHYQFIPEMLVETLIKFYPPVS